MSETMNFLAIDLGASSGRVMLGQWDGQRFALHELHRFPNSPVVVHGHVHWDVLRLWQEITTGIARYAAHNDAPLAGIGIDTWAVDFGLLDRAGALLGNPYHYRDQRTDGMLRIVDDCVLPKHLYTQTGIQHLPINTLYQLMSMRQHRDPQLDVADTLLLIPDLLHYWLTGRKVAEYTNATTTQFFDVHTQDWATDLLDALNLPTALLPTIVRPGTVLGPMLPEVCHALGLRTAVPIIATATHDTASAVAAIPGLDERSAYISSGTWSLVGIETTEPLVSDQARQLNFTNEGGVAGTVRLLKNVGGLWLVQECQRQWQRSGQHYTWPELVAQAEATSPLRSLVDPDAPAFLNPPDMPAAIRAYCQRTSQPEPESVGAIVRCCLESLALKYRWVVEALEALSDRTMDTVHIVGGGSQNTLLCQLTADACHRQVVAGPVEATALGNMLVQTLALGMVPDIAAGRVAIAASTEQTIYTPRSASDWDAAIIGFHALVGATGML